MNIARHLSSSAICKRVGGSTRPSICWRGNSNVASQEPSDLPKKRKKHIPLEERKAMVESYVNKYRAMNSGKFPTFSKARKEVGGGHHTVKTIILELQHQAKISNTGTVETTYKNIHQDGETRDDNVTSKEAGALSSVQMPFIVTVEEKPLQGDNQVSPETETAKNDESEHEVEEIRLFQPDLDVKIAENSCEPAASNVGSDLHKATKNDEPLHDTEEIRFYQSESDVKIAESSRKSAAASNVGSDLPKAPNAQFIETTLSEQMETPTGDTNQSENVIDDKLKVAAADYKKYFHKAENNTKMQDPPKLVKLEPEPDQQHQAQKLGTVTRDLSKHHADDTAVEKKSNLWDNMKSFADGIFSLFKKQ